ncbi:craniofacial development protein 2-like [Schistocerca americana]|uniref:craniofacial development protein 2-like n=1 Tax=Schistocerca americana TaxID=7009 RepID=UPI001F4F5F61|nr:craniofacial development protein 2-like [Schistocerca americana]
MVIELGDVLDSHQYSGICTFKEIGSLRLEIDEIVKDVGCILVGKDRKRFEQVLGCFGYGGRNEEGERLLDLCQRNGMKLANSWFMKRESHVITRYSSDRRTKSVIDYILANREWGERVTNVKIIPSVSADGDHRLLVGQWKMDECVKNRKQYKVMRIWN